MDEFNTELLNIEADEDEEFIQLDSDLGEDEPEDE